MISGLGHGAYIVHILYIIYGHLCISYIKYGLYSAFWGAGRVEI